MEVVAAVHANRRIYITNTKAIDFNLLRLLRSTASLSEHSHRSLCPFKVNLPSIRLTTICSSQFSTFNFSLLLRLLVGHPHFISNVHQLLLLILFFILSSPRLPDEPYFADGESGECKEGTNQKADCDWRGNRVSSRKLESSNSWVTAYYRR